MPFGRPSSAAWRERTRAEASGRERPARRFRYIGSLKHTTESARTGADIERDWNHDDDLTNLARSLRLAAVQNPRPARFHRRAGGASRAFLRERTRPERL